MSAALQKRLAALKLEVVKCRTSPLMAQHGPLMLMWHFGKRKLDGGGVLPLVVGLHCHVHTPSFFVFSCYLKDECFWMQMEHSIFAFVVSNIQRTDFLSYRTLASLCPSVMAPTHMLSPPVVC